ncbi:hypothetical protein AAC387_Pa05g0944 [Persea americana]
MKASVLIYRRVSCIGYSSRFFSANFTAESETPKSGNVTWVSANSSGALDLKHLLQRCVEDKLVMEGKSFHALVVQLGLHVDTLISNILINMYSKCGVVESARLVFEEMPVRSVVSWNTMIGAYTTRGGEQEGLRLLVRMHREGVMMSEFTVSSVLCACAAKSAVGESKQLHAFVLKTALDSNVYVGTALLDVYAKCSSIHDACRVFDMMPERSAVTWSSMVAGYVQNDLYEEALVLFHSTQKMGLERTQFTLSAALSACASLSATIEGTQQVGLCPNEVTYISVLAACSHAGLVETGRCYFAWMLDDWNVEPNVHHYSCMVDLLGRAGLIQEAWELIEEMPFDATASMWGSLLGSCRIHGNLELAELAAEHLFKMEPNNAGNHVLLSNVYAADKRWDEVMKARKLLKDSGAKKEMGKSWIEVRDRVHTFVVGEGNHPNIAEIYEKLDELEKEMKKLDYQAKIEYDLHDVGTIQKEELLRLHSEKLAVAFGLITIPLGAPIKIKKNLRICGDCHSVMKFVSRITGRLIIIRDTSRFHHFKDGWCSCGDFW